MRNFVIAGRCFRLDERRKSGGYSPFDAPFGTGGEKMRTVTVEEC